MELAAPLLLPFLLSISLWFVPLLSPAHVGRPALELVRHGASE